MRRWWILLLGLPVLAGCLNSKAVGLLLRPSVTFATPAAWDCAQRVPHPQGQMRLDSMPVMCDRCANRSATVQAVTVAESPYQVPSGAGIYRCENLQVLVDDQVTSYASTTPR